MKLIIGLGNPEQKYADTRHNVGFVVLDSYANHKGIPFTYSSKFHGDIAQQGMGEHKVLFLKPTTYYNLVGESARAVCDFYRISPQDVLIIHDDLALPLGTIRTRIGGSPAGNNGVKSITQHLGDTTARLRVGTYTEHRDSIADADFVLSKFTASEQKTILELLPKITGLIDDFLQQRFEPTTHK